MYFLILLHYIFLSIKPLATVHLNTQTFRTLPPSAYTVYVTQVFTISNVTPPHIHKSTRSQLKTIDPLSYSELLSGQALMGVTEYSVT